MSRTSWGTVPCGEHGRSIDNDQLRNKFAEVDAGAKGFLTNEEIKQLLKQTSWLKGMRVEPADLASIDCENPNLRLSFEGFVDQIFTAVAVNKR
jgi:hypothetical protein